MRQRILIHRHVPDVTRSGSPTEYLILVGMFWACVEPLGGTETTSTAAKQRVALSRYRVTIRQGVEVFPNDRLSYDGRVMNISSVVKVGQRSEFYEILCTEGVQ